MANRLHCKSKDGHWQVSSSTVTEFLATDSSPRHDDTPIRDIDESTVHIDCELILHHPTHFGADINVCKTSLNVRPCPTSYYCVRLELFIDFGIKNANSLKCNCGWGPQSTALSPACICCGHYGCNSCHPDDVDR